MPSRQISDASSVNKTIQNAIPNIFEDDIPMFDESYRNVLFGKILKHYYTREIGFETYGLWKLKLNTKLEEIMPYYNQLYKSELLKFDPLVNTQYSTKSLRKFDSENVLDGKFNSTSNDTEKMNETKKDIFDENENTVGNTKTNDVHEKGTTQTTEHNTNVEHEFGKTSTTNENGTNNTEYDTQDVTSKESTTNNTGSGSTNHVGSEKEQIVGSESTTNSYGNVSNFTKNSDTPQGNISNFEDNKYLSSLSQTDTKRGNDTTTVNYGGDRANIKSFDGRIDSSNSTNEETIKGTDTLTKTGNDTTSTESETTIKETGSNNDTETGNQTVTFSGADTDNGTTDIVNDVNKKGSNTSEDELSRQNDSIRNDKTDSTTTIKNLDDYVDSVFGKQGGDTYSEMLMKFRETFLNIDMLVIENLETLFMGVW